MSKIEIVKKLSIAKLVGKVTALLPDSRKDLTDINLGAVAGVARGIKTGVSTFGDWRCLTGDFVFQPMSGPNVGKRFRSGQLFLPDVAMDLVAPIAGNLPKGEGVEVQFMITARNDETSSVGYCYGASFLKEPETNDPLEALISSALPELPAPVGDKPAGDDKPAENTAGKAK